MSTETHEALASSVAAEVYSYYDNDTLAEVIQREPLAAIRAAVFAERERCAKMAESRFAKSPGHEGDEWRFAAGEIIDAIRALPGKEGE